MTFQAKPWLHSRYFQLCPVNTEDRFSGNNYISMKIKMLNKRLQIVEGLVSESKVSFKNVSFQFIKAESI